MSYFVFLCKNLAIKRSKVYNYVIMFNLQHVLYMVISFILTAGLLVVFALKVKDQKKKNLILVLSSVITVALHYSNIWVEYFANGGNYTVESNHILPVYPCNVVMWMLLAASLIKNKKCFSFRLLADFCFYGGIICGVVGIVFNANFDSNPTLTDYVVLKGLLSHSTMLFGCIYLFVGKYVKLEVSNVLGILAGGLTFVACGLIVDGLYTAFGMTPIDGMFLKSNPYFPVSPMVLSIPVILLIFGALALYELRLPKEQRWYFKLKKFFNKNKGTKEKV